jgi:double-stranded uracil-DNA glycosylase
MLKDVLTENLDVVFCGTAKGEASARLGYYYAGPGNKFYGVLHSAGFTPHRLRPEDCYGINQYKIGLTDLVHTEFGNDDEISDESYDVESFIVKMKLYKPKFIAFNSKKGASFVLGYKGITSLVEYGLQNMTIGESKIFVLPSTSGSARRFWDESYWKQLKKLITT